MPILEELTAESILNQQLPLPELLDNSFYYPSCEFDGGIVKFYAKEIQSFIYCDYAAGEERLKLNLNNFHGYTILAQRSLSEKELIPNGWKISLPPNLDFEKYYSHRSSFAMPFARWAVYERSAGFDDNHGPRRFSLIYIGGEGVATYQAIYWSNKKSAKALALIQPGDGFGLNWTDFIDKDGSLAWVVMKNQYGKPDTLFYGGYGGGNTNFDWEGYHLEKRISSYYGKNKPGEVTVWKRSQSE